MPRVELSRRAFLGGVLAGLVAPRIPLRARQRVPERRPRERQDPVRGLGRLGAHLRARYRDLPSHFIFEYYPWYSTSPWSHWDEGGFTPPGRLATNYLPRLGAYDSRNARIIEQHARWIAESGAGAVNVSWWGRGTFEDRAVPLVMDVMRDHGIKVTFYLEPYGEDRALRLVDDVKYLLREYGERRRWDNFLLLEHADGSAAPVMKMFAAVVAPTSTDCRGVTRPVREYVPDSVWRQQTGRLRRELAVDFDRFTLLGDALDVGRTRAGGFDGAASGDPYLHPDRWDEIAGWFNAEDLLLAFSVNPGFDVAPPAVIPTDDPCYRPPRVEPLPEVDWSSTDSRGRAHQASAARIEESFQRTLHLQTAPRSSNERRGFFLVYINSFNEWKEGTQFEPMVSFADLTESERQLYHNAASGTYRLDTIEALLAQVL